MRGLRTLLLALLSISTCALWAQERGDYLYDAAFAQGESLKVLEVDTTLFRLPINYSLDAYSQATRYYRAPTATRRRGLYYTTAEQLLLPSTEYPRELEEPLPQSRVTLYGAQSNYRVGLSASHASTLASTWSLSSSLWANTGRDLFVDGVFRNTFSPQFSLSRRFDDRHFLVVDGSLYYSMRGLQSSSTPEAFSLTGNNYYNPSWGFYNGEVRNARVRRELAPHLSVYYQRPVGSNGSLLSLEANADYSRQATSGLSWYNATTPSPDYYRKMPSYLSSGDVQDFVTTLWRTNDTDYTQIAWDELERLNTLSADGNAFYTLEDRVKRSIEGDFAAILTSEVGEGLTLSYGVEAAWQVSRNFKVMRDLLGADYLLDYDVFLDDSYNKTLSLQNNLQDPDRKIVEGDRFGYDYAITHTSLAALLRAQWRGERLDFDVEAKVGGESFTRRGYYEKERFSGDASLGRSSSIEGSPYTARASVGYALGANKYFALRLSSVRLSPFENNLFLNPTVSNYLSQSSLGELINSVALAFRYNGASVSLSGEAYALRSRDGSSVYSLYDDLTSTMCRASITGIGYSSYGVELVADLYLYRDLRLSSTLAMGSYRYDVDPYVELLSDYDLTTISAPVSSRMSGLNIGNAPQAIVTASATYFGLDHYILSASSSYSALRYEQPSMVRRSERILSQAFLNAEASEAALEQQRLGDVFDIEISAARYFWFESGGQLSVRLSVSNLLGQSSRVYYARESDRILLQSVDDYFTGATMREGTLQYGTVRTFKFSVGYKF